MRLGCAGCFLLIAVVLVIAALAGGMLFLSVNIFGTPDVRSVSYSREDGHSAQQKLFEVALRQSGRSSRKDPIVLSEREANAFLSHHLADAAAVPLSPLIVRFERGQLFAQGQTPVRNLFQGPPFAQILRHFSDRRLDQPVWVSVRGRVSLEAPAGTTTRYGIITLTQLELGRQPLSSFLLYLMMGPSGAGLFRWPVPGVVESIELEDGRAIIRTR